MPREIPLTPDWKQISPEEAAQAREQLAEELRSGFWMEVRDGMKVVSNTGQPDRIQLGTVEPLTFEAMGGIVAMVDERGRYFISGSTPDRTAVLEQAGYKRGLSVAFASGGRPEEESLAWQFELIQRAGVGDQAKIELHKKYSRE
jgi:hypothetical protein